MYGFIECVEILGEYEEKMGNLVKAEDLIYKVPSIDELFSRKSGSTRKRNRKKKQERRLSQILKNKLSIGWKEDEDYDYEEWENEEFEEEDIEMDYM